MGSRELHEALRHFAGEVAELLTRDLESGADLPFDVLEGENHDGRGSRGGGPVLYRYRPLTPVFIAARWERVRDLDSYPRAAGALRPGAARYLRHRGLDGSDPDRALRDVIDRLFEDATRFSLPEERFTRILAELDATLEDAQVRATVVAHLHGVRIASARVEVGEGLTLARRSSIASPPSPLEGSLRALESTAEGDDGDDGDLGPSRDNPLDVFCLLERNLAPSCPLPVDEARVLFRRVLTALRLCGAGGTALGPLAWARAGDGAWHPVALSVSARSRPESWELRHSEEHELHELLGILALSRHSPRVGWALARFEMGCDRALEMEALSDYLLGLRALLADPAGGADARTATRLAALCAPDEEQEATAEAVRRAFALERRLIHGGDEGLPGLALDSPRALVRDVEGYLRALLRDVLCGYLHEDLRQMADELTTGVRPPDEAGAGEIRVRDARHASEEEETAELEVVGGAVTPSVDWESG